ncbi:MAG: molybdopterin molybdotransferase MoeA [Chloroflexi bacterium]|nr:molybdopterin molybdotransferase MoeA [Chloroflexota bacterium]
MLSVEEALERVLATVQVLEPEERPLLGALGQVLAEDVVAEFDIPSLANSAMDGYALQHTSIRGASPQTPRVVKIISEIWAGQLPTREVTPGTAAHIMTGAPIPKGADTVVPFELTDERERRAAGKPVAEVSVYRELPLGSHVRPAGEDVARGQVVLHRGSVLRPAELGVLASLGHLRVKVIRRPEVAIIATGNELLAPGQPLEQGKIYDSNSYAIATAVLRYGGIPHLLGIARDEMEELRRKLEAGIHADLLVTSAGVSTGESDLVRRALEERGKVEFWSVRMRPAKPIAFGLLQGPGGRVVPHLGLPGNPVSALVAFEELGRPALLKMQGRTRLAKPTIRAVLEGTIVNRDHRRVYARVVVTQRDGKYYACPTGPQGSNLLTSMALANGLAICPENVPAKHAGDEVEVRMLDWNEETL